MAEETYTGEISVLTGKGDEPVVKWDRRNEDQVAIARETFEKYTDKRYAAFKLDREGGKGERITQFNPDLERILFVPQIAGGV